MKSIDTKRFVRFLKLMGLEFKRTSGSHEIWDRKKAPMLDRPIIFRGNQKQIPPTHIHTNLETLGISHKQFEEIMRGL